MFNSLTGHIKIKKKREKKQMFNNSLYQYALTAIKSAHQNKELSDAQCLDVIWNILCQVDWCDKGLITTLEPMQNISQL